MSLDIATKFLVFRKQFVAGPSPLPCEESWRTTRFSDLFVTSHPDLEITLITTNEVAIACLGDVIDPRHPPLGNREVLKQLVDNVRTFDDFESQTSYLGGRWIMFVALEGDLRIYPDAAGLKSLFYTAAAPSADIWIGSQPQLLSELLTIPIDKELLVRFISQKYQNYWPGEVTPFANVRQLLPNHYLDVRQGRAIRFWPSRSLDVKDPQEAAAAIGSILRNSMESAQYRRKLVVPLTGGYDSRTLFASAGNLRKNMEFFTIQDPDTEHYDLSIPRKLTKRCGASYRVLNSVPATEEFNAVRKRSTSYMVADPSDIKVYTLARIPPNAYLITGQVSAVAKCFYYPNGLHPGSLDGGFLAKIGGYENNAVAIASFASWLHGVPGDLGFNVLDLFYWELRLGNWASMLAAARDMVCDPIAPYNCRHLLEIALSVDVSYRASPYQLLRMICAHGEPKSLSVPFNSSLQDSVTSIMRRIVPWRLTVKIHQSRMKKAGLDEYKAGRDSMRELLEKSS